MTATRRTLLRLASALPLLGPAAALARTPAATEGPFYPEPSMRFADADNDLVKIEGAVREAGGEVLVLRGRVLGPEGEPAAGARVEIWQCDANGVYLHEADRRRGGYDLAFQGFGHVVTGPGGDYAFRTIRPVPYPGRTPHIHVKVVHEGLELTTQFYLEGHPQNERDAIFRRLAPEARTAVTLRPVARDGRDEALLDIRL